MVVVEAGILCWLVCWVRGDDQHFGELNTCAGYTPPRNNRVVYHIQTMYGIKNGIHHPEITGLYTRKCVPAYGTSGIHHPEITGLHTKLFFNEVEYPVVYRWTLCYHCREAI